MMTAKEAKQLTNENCAAVLSLIEKNIKKAAKKGRSYYIQSAFGQLDPSILKTLEDLGYVVNQLSGGIYFKYEISWS